jgi:AcrR family transcriptional regulator
VPRPLSADEIENFRGRVITAAVRLFAEHGPDAVSMRQLAAALDVSPMTPYRYFRDKDEILAAARASGFDRFAEGLESAQATNTDPVSRAQAVAGAYLRFAFDHPASYRLMFDLSQPTESSYPDLVRAASRARATMGAYSQGLMDAGLLTGDPVVISHIFWAAIHGLVVLKLAGKISPELEFDVLWREMSRALRIGFSIPRSDETPVA